MQKWIHSGVAICLFLITGCGVLDSFVLKPSEIIRRTPEEFGYKSSKLSLSTVDDNQMSIWHVKASSKMAKKGIIVVVPGNDDNKGRYTVALPVFCDNGWDVVLMDYVGFGESTGQPSFAGLIDSARSAFDYAFTQDKVVVGFGVSMGTPVLARVAADYDLTACIFESTVDVWSVSSAFLDHFGLGSPFNLVTDTVATLSTPQDYDTKFWIEKVTEPKLFIHSPDDNVTPYTQAWEVYKHAPQPKHFLATEGEHALQMFIDPVLYRSMVNGYLDGILNQDPIENKRFQEILDTEIHDTLEQMGWISNEENSQ